jgi:hypothetical protein
MEEAKLLFYPNLLGVCQYPSAYTRFEMRYAMSLLSRHRTKWGIKHFEVLLKAPEYGYSTKKMGLKYDGNLDADKTNVLKGLRVLIFSLSPSVSRMQISDDEQCSHFFYLQTTLHN